MLNSPRACNNREQATAEDVERTTGIWGGHKVDKNGWQGAGRIEARVGMGARGEEEEEKDEQHLRSHGRQFGR